MKTAPAKKKVVRPPFKTAILTDLAMGQCVSRCCKANRHEGDHEYLCVACGHGVHDGKMCLVCTVDFSTMITPTGTCNCGDRRSDKDRRHV
jgi:hypothetical protein